MAKRKAKKKIQPNNSKKTARLNLMLTPELKEWAHGYSRRREKSISALISDYLIDLRERERGECVEQI